MKLTFIEKNIIKLIKKFIPNIDKLIKLSDAIEDIRVDTEGSLFITYKKHVVNITNGINLQYSKGMYIQKSETTTHINPNNFIYNRSDNTVEYLMKKENELRRKHNITK